MISVVPLASGHDAAGGGDAGDLRVGDLVLDVAGQVVRAAAGQRGGDDQLLGVVAALSVSFAGWRIAVTARRPASAGRRRSAAASPLIGSSAGGSECREVSATSTEQRESVDRWERPDHVGGSAVGR